MKLWVAYGFFSLLATVVNIAVQEAAIRFYCGPYSLMYSVGVGTMAGLLLKYVLDKRYIFRFKAQNAVHDGHTFFLYAMMGVVTTAVFWGFEFGFQYLFESRKMRYLGAVLGLGLGYLAKYHLDRRFVFCKEAAL